TFVAHFADRTHVYLPARPRQFPGRAPQLRLHSSHPLRRPVLRDPPIPYPTLFRPPRAIDDQTVADRSAGHAGAGSAWDQRDFRLDRKSTRLNSSHVAISYAVFCLKKKKTEAYAPRATPIVPASGVVCCYAGPRAGS